MSAPTCPGEGPNGNGCGDEGIHHDDCPVFLADEAYYHKLYGGMSRSQLMACDPRPMTEERREALEQELRDAGRIP